jgi:hypothetical protein
MNFLQSFLIGFILIIPSIGYCQEQSLSSDTDSQNLSQFYGFVRAGLYTGIDHNDKNKPLVSSAFSDIGLKVNIENEINFKAFADLRFRYGSEFQKPVNQLDIREAYIRINGKTWDLSTGQKIIKWGRTDFTNPTSKLSAQNLISRSPDREDMDIGNLLSSINWYPSEYIKFEVVAIPFYRSSVLIIEPVTLPQNITIRQLKTLVTDMKMYSYGLRADIHLIGIDWGISWFDGYDPMPGIALSNFNLDMSGPIPIPLTELTVTPYKTRLLGLDFETTACSFGIRGEAALTVPYLSSNTYEYIPLPEIKWVTGIDWSSGIWRLTGEYSGKYIDNFTQVTADPLIGTEPDYSLLAQLITTPGFDLSGYVKQQVGAFNRLYNYQLKRYYHTGAFRVESDLAYGKIIPSLFSMYNFTSRDFLLIPEIKYKPSDGLTITAGGEFYKGPIGSLYDITDDFMNTIYLSFRVDF